MTVPKSRETSALYNNNSMYNPPHISSSCGYLCYYHHPNSRCIHSAKFCTCVPDFWHSQTIIPWSCINHRVVTIGNKPPQTLDTRDKLDWHWNGIKTHTLCRWIFLQFSIPIGMKHLYTVSYWITYCVSIQCETQLSTPQIGTYCSLFYYPTSTYTLCE